MSNIQAYEIRKIAERVAKRHDLPKPIVEKYTNKYGVKIVEVRSEFRLLDGTGTELCAEVEKKFPEYQGEYNGNCVWRFYRP